MNRRRCSLATCVLSGIALLSGCAVNPPSSTSSIPVSGHQLHVIMPFEASITSPAYHYYFLINYDQSQGPLGNKNAPGPLPILYPTTIPNYGYGNGFAISSNGTATAGFTDYVEFTNYTFTLWHVSSGDPTGRTFIRENTPLSSSFLNNSNSSTLEFTLDLAQIVAAASGGEMTSSQIISQAQQIQWLQVNMVATDVVPLTPTPVLKQVDSLGDTQAGPGAFLLLNVQNAGTIGNSSASSLSFEPSENDVFTSGSGNTGDPSLNLLDSYSIQVTLGNSTTGTPATQSLKSSKP